MDKLNVQEVPEEIQKRNLEERAFMLKVKVQASAKPKASYRIMCFECNQEYYLDLTTKSPLTDAELNTYLVMNDWQIGSRGYQCPNCFNGWVKGVVDFVTQEKPMVVESTQEPRDRKVFIDNNSITMVMPLHLRNQSEEFPTPSHGDEVLCHYCQRHFIFIDITSQVGPGMYWCGCKEKA